LDYEVIWFPWRILNLHVSRGKKKGRQDEKRIKKGGEKKRERKKMFH